MNSGFTVVIGYFGAYIPKILFLKGFFDISSILKILGLININFKSVRIMIFYTELEQFYCKKFLNQPKVKIVFSNGNESSNSKSLTLNET